MSLERDHDRAQAPAISTTPDSDLAPGRSNRSNQLASPERPLVSALIQRKARDENGVAESADLSVATASTSTGHALPGTLMRKFESSLGADLSQVRVHTSSESHVAADAVGAKAYTIGNDIHFGAGHYDPTSHTGQHLLAHEVAHTVQQSGSVGRKPMFKLEVSQPNDGFETEADQAADAMVTGDSFSLTGIGLNVARKPDAQAHEGPSLNPPDMTPVDWRAGGAVSSPPDVPKPISIAIQMMPPLPAGVTNDPLYGTPNNCNPKPDDDIFHTKPHWSLSVYDQRQSAWLALKSSIKSVETIYNSAVTPITAFNDAEKDPTLAQLYEFQQDGTSGKNMHQVANEQKVPRTSPSAQTVGGQFQNVAGASVGTDANTKGLDDNIKRASQSKEVEQAITNLRAKDAALASSLSAMDEAQLAASAAGHRAAASQFKVQQAEAEEKKEGAEDAKKSLTEKAETVKKYVEGALKLVGFIAGAVAAPEAVAAGGLIVLGDQVGAYKPTDPSPGGSKVPGAIAKGAESSIASTVAEKLIGYVFESDIDAQENNIKSATAAYRTAHNGEAKEDWLAASDELASKLAGIKKTANDMKSKLMDRKGAYQKLADAAATAGGGSQADQDRMRALIMAIPVAKAVIAQSSNVLNVVNNNPEYNEASAIGFHMAMGAQGSTAMDLMSYYGQILGYRDEFKQHFDFWTRRVTSLEGVIGKFEGK